MKYIVILLILSVCCGITPKKLEPISPEMDAYLNDQAPDDPAVEEWEAWRDTLTSILDKN